MAGCDDCCGGTVAQDRSFRRVLWIALAANASMFLVELVASAIGDSMSLQADALDFFSDAANYGISLFVVGAALASRARASLFKGATMAAFGLWVLGSAVWRALTGSDPDPAVMSGIGVLALAVNVGVAALLFSHRNGDSNRQSIWLCSRNDAIGNLAVIAAAGGVFASGTAWPDLAVAGVIAALNVSAAVHVVRLARAELRLDRPAPLAEAGR
ncbi:MAG TPA: cation transporter [Pseudomonadales bacterium]